MHILLWCNICHINCSMKHLILSIYIMLFACTVQAQESNFYRTFYIGFTSTIPVAPAGGMIGVKAGKGLLFLDTKIGSFQTGANIEKYSNFYGNITNQQAQLGWGDQLINQKDWSQDYYVVMDLNYAYPVHQKWALYGGVGMYSKTVTERRFQNFNDPSKILGDNGSYWISHENYESQKTTRNNYLAFGVMYKSDGWFWAKAGMETHFLGPNIAIGMAF